MNENIYVMMMTKCDINLVDKLEFNYYNIKSMYYYSTNTNILHDAT